MDPRTDDNYGCSPNPKIGQQIDQTDLEVAT